MTETTRRQLLMSLFVPLTLTACGGTSEAERIARQFMEAYYRKIDLKVAKSLSAGLAEEKITAQLSLVEGQSQTPLHEIPRLDYRLISSAVSGEDEASYIFEIHSHSQAIGKRKVFLKLRQDQGSWKLRQFVEENPEDPPVE